MLLQTIIKWGYERVQMGSRRECHRGVVSALAHSLPGPWPHPGRQAWHQGRLKMQLGEEAALHAPPQPPATGVGMPWDFPSESETALHFPSLDFSWSPVHSTSGLTFLLFHFFRPLPSEIGEMVNLTKIVAKQQYKIKNYHHRQVLVVIPCPPSQKQVNKKLSSGRRVRAVRKGRHPKTLPKGSLWSQMKQALQIL